MLNIKRFLDRVSATEGKRSQTLILPMEEARLLRDEIAKLLSDLHALSNKENSKDVIKVEITGGKFK